MGVSKYSVEQKVQADGAQIIELTESGFMNQISVGGTATSGTLAFEYKNANKWYNLNKNGSQLVIDMANNASAYIVKGCFDTLRVTPDSITGGYYTVEVISEVM